MKKKGLGKGAGKVILFVVSLILAFVFWFVVKYSQLGDFSLTLFNFG